MPAADSGFIRLADVLLARPDASARAAAGFSTLHSTGTEAVVKPAPSAERDISEADSAAGDCTGPYVAAVDRCGCELSLALREARLFRAALADAFTLRIDELMNALAADVLGRELQLDRVAVGRIAMRLVGERDAEQPLRLRLAPADAHVDCGLPVCADPALVPGDVVLECRGGEIDARLSVRLRDVLMAGSDS